MNQFCFMGLQHTYKIKEINIWKSWKVNNLDNKFIKSK